MVPTELVECLFYLETAPLGQVGHRGLAITCLRLASDIDMRDI